MNILRIILAFFKKMLRGFAGYKVQEAKFRAVAGRLGEALVIAGLIGLMVAGDNVNVYEGFALFATGFILVVIGLRNKNE